MKTHQFENLPQRKPDTISTIYTDKFEAYLEEQRKNGLQYINIYYGEGKNQFNVDYAKFCEEFIKMQESPTVEDREFF
jgi:hypothetical protein